jgi:D-amino-acid dehydrogenase
MHVVVIGAGIIGVTTAYCLRRQGCEVSVVERRGGVAREASFANGGVIAPGYTGPWSAPGVARSLLLATFRRDAPLRVRWGADRALWRWLRRFVEQGTLDHLRTAKLRMHRLAAYSQEELHSLVARHAIEFEQQSGLLQLFRTEEDVVRHAPLQALLTEFGVAFRLLTADECRRLEPSLNEHTALAAAIHLPDDETGNCAFFARRLKEISEQDGVRFEFDAEVKGLDIQAGRLVAVSTSRSRIAADACVLAAGADSAALLAVAGIELPLVGVKGYSATVPIARHDLAPLVAIMDQRYKVAVTRMGKRLRIAGTAMIGDRSSKVSPGDVRTLLKVARDWYPGAAAYSGAQLWAGVRPMLPDGPPVLGRTPVAGLFLNVGHGSSGWAMACGSARIVADLVTGHAPAIDLDGLTLDRFAQPALSQARPALSTP